MCSRVAQTHGGCPSSFGLNKPSAAFQSVAFPFFSEHMLLGVCVWPESQSLLHWDAWTKLRGLAMGSAGARMLSFFFRSGGQTVSTPAGKGHHKLMPPTPTPTPTTTTLSSVGAAEHLRFTRHLSNVPSNHMRAVAMSSLFCVAILLVSQNTACCAVVCVLFLCPHRPARTCSTGALTLSL